MPSDSCSKRRALEPCQRASSHVNDIGMNMPKACLVGVRALVATIRLWTNNGSCGGLQNRGFFVNPGFCHSLLSRFWMNHFYGEAVKCNNTQHKPFNSSWIRWFMWLQLALDLFSLLSRFRFVSVETDCALNLFIRNLRNPSVWIWRRGQEILPLGPPVPDPLLPDAPLTPAPFPGGRGAQSWQIDKSKNLCGNCTAEAWNHRKLYNHRGCSMVLSVWQVDNIPSSLTTYCFLNVLNHSQFPSCPLKRMCKSCSRLRADSNRSGWQDSSIASISTQWTFHYIVL